MNDKLAIKPGVSKELVGNSEGAEEALQESEDRLKIIFESVQTGIIIIDSETHRIIDANSVAVKLIGAPKEQIVGSVCHRYICPTEKGQCPITDLEKSVDNSDDSSKELIGTDFMDYFSDQEKAKAGYQQVFKDGFVQDYALEIRQKDGHLTPVLCNASVYRDEAGQVMGVFAAARDITERKKMEETLRKSEEKYRTILKNIEEGYYEVDLAGNFTFLNDSMCSIFGYPKDELMGMNDRQYTDKENAKRLFQAFNEAYRTSERRIGYGYEIIRKDGTKRYIEPSILLQKDSSDKPIGFRGIIRDITERKRAEETLWESQELYRSLFEGVPIGLYRTMPSGEILDTNLALVEMLGYPDRESLLVVNLVDMFVNPDERKQLETLMERQGVVHDFEAQFRRYDGTVIWIRNTCHAARHDDGQTLYHEGAIQDITERKRAEEALRQEKDFNQTLVQASPLFFAAIHPDGKTLMMNEAMLRALGYTTDEVVGKDYLSTFVPVADREMLGTIFQRLVNQKEPALNENRVLTRDGRELLVEWHGRQVFKANGDLDYFFGVGIDITQRKQVEEKMASLREQLGQSQKMEAIGRLAGGIAHDFNNLLTVIKGYSQIFRIDLKESDLQRKNVEQIIKATDRAAVLIRQLLAFSRRQILEMKVLDLNFVLRDLEKMLRRVISEDIELTIHLTDDLGRVKTDPGQIEQVVMNLAVNAKDAMPNGGRLTIETANVDLDDAYAHSHIDVTPGRYVMLSVSDNGVGMSPEVKERVFEPFFTTKERDKGTGLGLSTVYGIVKQSEGNVWVYSEPGKGTTFKIYLPRVEEALEDLEKKVVTEELPHGSETILVVEDEERVRQLAVYLLENLGYKVLQACDGDDALRICEKHGDPIPLMLTDVVMPKMNGRASYERLITLHPEMKVLYMSGYTEDAILHHGVLEQKINYIQKPFALERLAGKVRQVLDKDSRPTV